MVNFQIKLNSDDIMPSRRYNCFYCGNMVDFTDLIWIDNELGKLDTDRYEFIVDGLPNSSKARMKPYIHNSDLGYDVLNICRNCFEQARKHR